MNLNVKLNKFERVAGLFVLTAGAGILISVVGVAVKKGWFESKSRYVTTFESGEGLYNGTPVNMSGLRIGSVTNVELRADNKVEVEIQIFKKFSERFREDSKATLLRPYIIGEKILEVTVGSMDVPQLAEGDRIMSVESMDLMSLLGGRNLGNALGDMGDMVKNLRFLAEAFLDKDRTANLVKIFDRIDPLLTNLNSMSLEVTKLSKAANKDDRLATVLRELAVTTKELNAIMPDMKARAPKLANDLEQLVANLAVLTESSKVLLPALAEIAPDLPRSSRRAVEALDETVVLLKALQKSFLLRSSAAEVRAEQKREDEGRKPATEGGH